MKILYIGRNPKNDIVIADMSVSDCHGEITIEDNGKEKRKAVSIYVQAGNVTEANKTLQQALSNLDCEVVSITRSPIIEVFRAV